YQVYKKTNKIQDLRPPLGLMYIAAAAESVGWEASIIDAQAEDINCLKIINLIENIKPDFVGITATTPEYFLACYLSEKIKRQNSNIKIVIGGAHVSATSSDCLSNANFDYIVVGEGENAIRKILIDNPTERIINSLEMENLNSNILPARHLVDYSRYNYPVPDAGMIRMDAIESSRGCPFCCSFCFNSSKHRRPRDVGSVVSEIENSYKNYDTKFFMFFDDTFTVDPEFVYDFCDMIIKKNLNHLTFYVNARANTIKDKKIFKVMKDAGITEISMGVESGSEEILKKCKRGVTKDQYRRVYDWMFSAGLQTRGSFIIGHPYETEETVWETINFAKELPLVRASCNIMTPYPGTLVYEQAKKGKGIHLIEEDWNQFKRWGQSVIETDSLTKKDLEGLQKTFLIEFFSQRKIISYHVKQFLKGNRSYYYYRPILYAIKNRLKNI
ncbi:MAG: B12-binding domain-containing radical SAM protein, partial [Atribacterota bacterium]